MTRLIGLLSTMVLLLSISVSSTGAAPVPDGYDPGVRPDPAGTPTPVQVAVFLIDLVDVNDISQSFRASLYFFVRYRDPRLADAAAPTVRTFELEEIWWPDLGLINRRGLDFMFPHVLEVDPDGNVEYRQRVFGDLSARLDLREFPFDRQQLPVEVLSFRYGTDEVDLIADLERSGMMENLSLPGWSISGGGVESLPARADVRHLAQLPFHIEVTRDAVFYRWSALVPLCFIIFMAWCVFWIPPQYLPSQVGLSTASVFSLIAFRFSLRAFLPEVSYMTRLDLFVLAATVLVFSALAEAIAAGSLAKSGHEELAKRMDVWARGIYLVVAVVLAMVTLGFRF